MAGSPTQPTVFSSVPSGLEDLAPRSARLVITDEWFSCDARGEQTDLYQSTLHSGGYYHTQASYWPNGAIDALTGTGGYWISYLVDGEGRISSDNNGTWTATTYNSASQPTQITYGSTDSDNFGYDPNTGRMTQYKYNVNGQSVVGNLTWNALGTLQSLAITDPFNSTNSQTCSYSHDDLVRIASANCGSVWSQTFSYYDPFGNIEKSGSMGFSADYSSSTNRMNSIGTSGSPTYDADGNVTNDFLHTYSWDAYGRPTTIDGVNVTYDAFDRAVEQNRSGSYLQIAYSPSGFKMEIMSGQSTQSAFSPAAGGAMVVYASGHTYYRHPDWLGSSRLTSDQSRNIYSDSAYGPFGEVYAQSGTADPSFTGKDQNTSSNLYDFPAREYGIQGRWPSPDPAGLAAANPADPQSWNRYSYVRNSPLNATDPTGQMMVQCAPCAGGTIGGGGMLSVYDGPSVDELSSIGMQMTGNQSYQSYFLGDPSYGYGFSDSSGLIVTIGVTNYNPTTHYGDVNIDWTIEGSVSSMQSTPNGITGEGGGPSIATLGPPKGLPPGRIGGPRPGNYPSARGGPPDPAGDDPFTGGGGQAPQPDDLLNEDTQQIFRVATALANWLSGQPWFRGTLPLVFDPCSPAMQSARARNPLPGGLDPCPAEVY